MNLAFGNLDEIQFHRRLTSENGNGDAQLSLVVIDFVHNTVEPAERSVDDADLLALVKAELGPGALLAGFH